MKYLFDYPPKVFKNPDCLREFLLMLDFDGVLSPIVNTPKQAVIDHLNFKYLNQIKRVMPVAVISGRSLKDIKSKVGIRKIDYAGSHGMEWIINNKYGLAKIPKSQLAAIHALGFRFFRFVKGYKGALLENKHFSLTLHYRLIDSKKIKKFKSGVNRIVFPFIRKKFIKILKGKKSMEILPNFIWNKGNTALMIWQKANFRHKRRLIPIYIGDDTTDEDAFLALRFGITIRVGKKNSSNAKYFLKNVEEVRLFFKKFLIYN